MSKKEQKFTREALLKSRQFAHVQQDFLAALLVKNEYSMAEAKRIVSAFERSK